MLSIFLSVLLGLLVADFISFSIYNLCEFFSEKKSDNTQTSAFKKYINYILTELTNNRVKFLAYYCSIYALTIGASILMINLYGVTAKAFAGMLFCYCLIILTYVDAKTQMLPDIITKPLIILGLVQSYFGLFTDLQSSLIGAIAGYGSLWTINTLFRIIRHKDGMGYGDFKLFAAIGAWDGYLQLPFVIFAASVLGIFVALFLARLPENKLSSPSPFGPSLALSGFVCLIWGRDIAQWYWGLFM